MSESNGFLPPALLNRIGFVLNKAAQGAMIAVDARLAKEHIHSRHYGIMALLEQAAPLSQSEIGQQLKIDRTTMVALIDDLETLGYVRRYRNPDDRRFYALNLTSAGQVQLQTLHRIVGQAESQYLNTLTEAEHAQLLSLLIKILSTEQSEESRK